MKFKIQICDRSNHHACAVNETPAQSVTVLYKSSTRHLIQLLLRTLDFWKSSQDQIKHFKQEVNLQEVIEVFLSLSPIL